MLLLVSVSVASTGATYLNWVEVGSVVPVALVGMTTALCMGSRKISPHCGEVKNNYVI